MKRSDDVSRVRVVVAVCTYRRNDPLRLLLEKLKLCAENVRERAALGVIIVDDTAEGLARPVAEEFIGQFELGLDYAISGKQNISLARNLALERATALGDWVAMTDDDCEPAPFWLEEFFRVQQRTGADAVTGALRRRAPEGSPSWLSEQPFMHIGINTADDGASVGTAATNCSMIRTKWLLDHPEIRFDPALGVLGGEDMVFYRTARKHGLAIHYSSNGFVYENQPESRLSYAYQLHRFFWEGNSSYVTCVTQGLPPWRMFVHGVAGLARAGSRPLFRLTRGERPQWRFALAEAANGFGKMVGLLGVRVRHH